MRSSEVSKLPAAVGLFLGLASLGAVLCLRFPGVLTTPGVRALYPVELIRVVIRLAEGLALGASLLALMRKPSSRPAWLGLVATGFAFSLGGSRASLGPATPGQGLLGLDWMVADGLLMASLFLPLEKLAARIPSATRRAQWRVDALHFVINHLGVHAVGVCSGLLIALVATSLGAPLGFTLVSSAPLFVQVLLALLVADVIEYWLHRAMHEVPALWRIHAVHHSSHQMDALAGSRVHLVETLVTRSLVALALVGLGVSFPAVLVFGAVITVQATMIHANVRLPYGWLEAVLVSPRFHHWHHASDAEAIDTNYAGTFAFLDTLFGTRHLPAERWPQHFGVVREEIPANYLGQLVFPWTGK